MALQTNTHPDNIDSSTKISQDTNVPIDIAVDRIPQNNLDALLGRENGMGESYGTGVSQIAKPYQSPNFKQGVSGWRLGSNGIIEAVGVILSGAVSTTGNAASATKLYTPRAIYGNNFDGTAAISGPITSAYGGTGNGFTKFTGPASTEKTFTLPNATCTILTTNDLVTSAQGGTGNGFTKFTGPASTEKTFTLPNATCTILTTNDLVTAAQGGTGNGFTKFTGASSTEKTYTLPNATTTILTTNSTITVGQGGTGATTLTGILLGTGTTAITTITPLAGTKVYYVADSSGGAVTRKLTFTDGILTSES